MLILTRKSDESIIIGNNIKIKVLKIQGNQVHIGIDAPKDYSIYREEIFEQIRRENENARSSTAAGRIEQLETNLTGLKNMFFQGRSEPAPDKDESPKK